MQFSSPLQNRAYFAQFESATQAIRAFYDSIRIPMPATMAILGAVLLAALPLAVLSRLHLRLDIDWLYYPTFAIVYAVWILPILGFMLASVPLRAHASAAPKTRFLCLVPAYNEERVIGNPIRSLLAQKYPKDLYEVVVVFDGDDGTGETAAAMGAEILTTPTAGYGKHQALAYAMRQLLQEGDERYVAVFDADNVVSSNYLSAMNDAIASGGHGCLQCFHDVLNGSANWITKALWAACVSSSRLYLMGRARLLRNVLICGTGWCCRADLLRRYWPRIKTQTEDIELNGLLALEEGIRVAYVPQAHIYDEKPLSLWVAIRQRMRWMCGHSRVAYYYFWRCLSQGVLRRDAALLELAAYYLVPFALLASFVSLPLLVGLSTGAFRITGPLANPSVNLVFEVLSFFFIFGYQIVGFAGTAELTGTPLVRAWRTLVYSLYTVPFSVMVWPTAVVWALFRVNRDDWLYHTPHVSTDETSAAAIRAAALLRHEAAAVVP